MSGERLDYENERRRHETFVGRAELLARLDQWLLADGTDRWVVVTGGPGMGKSALLAAWLGRREETGAPVPHHFIRRGQYDWDDPAKLVGSLVAQLEEAFPGVREPEGDPRWHPATRLGRALIRVSREVLALRGDRLVVLIDGLDEYDPPAGALPGDPLAAFLPHALPAGVRVLCASRPRHPYLASLAAREGELVSIDLDAPDRAADNDATVRAYWEREAGSLGLDTRFVDEAVARAVGNVQHAVQLRKHLAVLPTTQRQIEDIPQGLAALHERSWERIASDETGAKGLGILCAAREALTLDELGAVAGWTGDAQRRQFLRAARELLVETRRDEHTGRAPNAEADGVRRAEKPESVKEGALEYRLHHDSIRRYIAEAIGERAHRAHHCALAQRLASWPSIGDAAARRYALRRALIHRAEAGDWPDAWRVAGDTSFLEAKLRELGLDDTEADVARIALRCRAMGDDVHARRFDDLARAIARDSHWLRADPAATAALIWNRLRQKGWSTNELDAQLRIPTERASFLRIRHAATRESPALVRDLVSDGRREAVRDCVVTPDARRVISASIEGLTVWDLETGRPLAILKDTNSNACAVTADGRRAISASGLTLTVWDLEAGRLLFALETYKREFPKLTVADRENVRSVFDHESLRAHRDDYRGNLLTAFAVTRNGRLVSASSGGALKIWDLESGRLLATLEGHRDSVTACVVTHDDQRVVSASRDHTLKVWELETGHLLATLEGHGASVNDCAVTPDGRRVVSASTDGTLKVWDLETSRPLLTVDGPTREHCTIRAVLACAVTPDGRRVVSASSDDTLKVWELETGHAISTLEGHSGMVHACVVTPDGRRVVSASADGTLKAWDLEGCRSLTAMESHADYIGACAVTPDGRRAVSTSMDGTQKIWDLESGHLRAALEGDVKYVVPCAVSPDGRRMVSARRRRLKVWELESGRLLTTLEDPAGWGTACVVSPDGRRVISASGEGILQIWDLDSGRSLAILRGDYADAHERLMTSHGGFTRSTSPDGTVKMKGSEGGVLVTVEGYSDDMTACAVTPDGQRVVFATSDGVLKVWNLETGRTLLTMKDHVPAWLTACAVTSDGKRVISASRAGTLKIWDLETGHLLTTLEGHRGDVTACALSPDGRHVVSASEDRTLKIWDLETHACILTFHGDEEYTAVAATATAIVAGGRAGGLWFLDVPWTHEATQTRPSTDKHTILLLAANPIGTDRLSLDREARAIQAPHLPPAFAYDVLVVHASDDRDRSWTMTTLVRLLEQRGLRVAVESRDAELGESRLLEIERLVSTSRFTLPVLTPRFSKGRFEELQTVMAQQLGLEDGRARLLPVVREPCEAWLGLQFLVHLDLTRDEDVVPGVERLVHKVHKQSTAPPPGR